MTPTKKKKIIGILSKLGIAIIPAIVGVIVTIFSFGMKAQSYQDELSDHGIYIKQDVMDKRTDQKTISEHTWILTNHDNRIHQLESQTNEQFIKIKDLMNGIASEVSSMHSVVIEKDKNVTKNIEDIKVQMYRIEDRLNRLK